MTSFTFFNVLSLDTIFHHFARKLKEKMFNRQIQKPSFTLIDPATYNNSTQNNELVTISGTISCVAPNTTQDLMINSDRGLNYLLRPINQKISAQLQTRANKNVKIQGRVQPENSQYFMVHNLI